MSAMALKGFGVFGDEVYTSTDLNRRSGEVLNHARVGPVTISRNNEQFALLNREHAAKLVRTLNRMSSAIEVLSEVGAVIAGEKPSSAFSWLVIFDKGDLQKLTAEVLVATRDALSGTLDWDRVEAIIHEWRESGFVAQSGVLDAAMYADSANEGPLPKPECLIGSEDLSEPECTTKTR